ncbi:tetratricopeptide repeat protein [Flavobacterium sp. MAH-1]|uniref:Tetratricopeptide repeat protein n=1 Tax=Flavobacterium agri TaxID=2743471 RepID=A0A7Y9C4M7_9FLAO|nr:tetratricopeptide repeat protein [Flavobacterium agri]NUY80341.1 tetratricopeptide repeat protein [Flavobacterium agri]NYA70366.1 tetratricopeptide repeat protein [Flavobacterium agri]
MPFIRVVLSFVFACLLAQTAAWGQTRQDCDSLIVKGVKAMQNQQHAKSLELLAEAKSIAHKQNWPEQEFLAINNIGANYYILLEYGEALDHYLEAYTLAIRKLQPKFEMIVLNNIAILYSKEKKFDKADEYFGKAYNIAKENNDKLKIGLYAMNLGNVANEVHKPQIARDYFLEAIPLLKNQPEFSAMAKVGMAESEYQQGRWSEARTSALQIYDSIKNSAFEDAKTSSLIIAGKSFLKENNLPQAEKYLNLLIASKPNLETKITLFDMLSDLHFRAKRFDKALVCKDSIIKINSQLEAIKNGKLLETNKAKFEIKNYQNELVLKEAKITNERRIFYSITAIILVILALVIWSLRNRSIKHKQKKLIAERNQQILYLELEKEKNEHLLLEKLSKENETTALLEQERLKNELEARNRKLSAKALYLSGRNEMIEEVLSELSKIPQLSEDKVLSTRIDSLKKHLKSDGQWDDFITHFEEVNHTFLNALKTKHANLTANDIRFLSYIYMNLSNKEIASMLNITVEACRKRKERLSDKMSIPEHVNLYDYLATL